VNCSATDSLGNAATASFTVTVITDVTAPVVTVPASFTVEAASPIGSVVGYTATAADDVDGTIPVSCDPPSGSTFASRDRACRHRSRRDELGRRRRDVQCVGHRCRRRECACDMYSSERIAVPAHDDAGDLRRNGRPWKHREPHVLRHPTPPSVADPRYRDSASLSFSGGNAWKEVGSWTASALPSGMSSSLGGVRAWLGLKNSDDQGTRFDVRVEVYLNGTMLVSGETRCIVGVTRNADNAKLVDVALSSFAPVSFNATDVFSLKVLSRIGTTPAGAFCGGHNSAAGLRLYFDATTRPAALGGGS
jgi:hypothetical protein